MTHPAAVGATHHAGNNMPRITKVYTRTGDDGTTGLGTGARVLKTSARITAYGTADELNSCLGVVAAMEPHADLAEPLRRIQNELFHLGADLCIPDADKAAMPGPKIEPRHIEALEVLMDRLGESLSPLENFILPGGTAVAGHLHVARTICRRAERDAIALSQLESVSADVIRYLNRLSDALFVMARYENVKAGVVDPQWDSRA
jgi:cob(I)alamin adenosyltransferase